LIRCWTDPAGSAVIRLITRLLVAAYLIEAGVLLVVAPWTSLWDQNFFARVLPWLGAWMASPYVRGGVTGIGVLTAVAGLKDLAGSFVGRAAAEHGHDGPA
jgi:hypothetical protein